MIRYIGTVLLMLIILCGPASTGSDNIPTPQQEFKSLISKCHASYYEKNTHHEADIPLALVLGIAIHESAWGNSRFSKEGYNYFGLRTTATDKKHYMTPKGAPNVKVARFEDRCGSVHFFITLISTDERYSELYNFIKQSGDYVDYEKALTFMDVYYEDSSWPAKVLNIIRSL